MNNMRILFMGTPEFAVESLKALVDAGKNIVGVITAPDKPKGRGKKLAQSPVKEFALQENLTVLQPTNLKDPQFLNELKDLNVDLQVVVAFRMLPEAVWSMPPEGTFNLHASLLPQYRGAAPINWAILNGEKETGVTTFFLKHEIDTGNIIFQETEHIAETDNVGDLYGRLMKRGAKLVVRTVDAIENREVEVMPQTTDEPIKHAPKIFKEDCKINWNRDVREIYNFIRGLSPYPAAWTNFEGKQLKIFTAQIKKTKPPGGPGIIESDGKTYLAVNARDGQIFLEQIQVEGKKRIRVTDFLRGYHSPLSGKKMG